MKLILMCLSAAFLWISCKDAQPTDELAGKLSTELVEQPLTANHTDSTVLNSLGRLQFKDTVHDFKTIKEGEKVSAEFEFENTGNKTILISNAVASCGCTKPEYPTAPIAQKEKGVIKVTFDSKGKMGHNEKSIVVTTNGNPSQYVLYIKTEVEK